VPGAVTALPLGLTLLTVAAVAGPVTVDAVPAGFASWGEVYALQNRLNAAADRIESTDGAGNASIVANPLDRELRVYWKGEVPVALRTLAGGLGVPVKFLAASFTHRELVEEAKRLAGVAGVAEAAPQTNGDGLAVTVVEAVGTTARASLQSATRLPLTVTTGEMPRQLSSRQLDVPPFSGGSAYDANNCSNGYAVQVAGSPNVHMLTAGHCAENGDPVILTGQPVPTGTFTHKNICRDTAMINTRLEWRRGSTPRASTPRPSRALLRRYRTASATW
jgi:hypothetical protein